MAVELVARLLRIAGGHGDEAESANLSRLAVCWHEAIDDASVLLEERADVGFRSVKRQVSHIELDLGLSGLVEPAVSTWTGARATLALWSRFVDTDGAPIKLRLVHLVDRLLCGVARCQGDKAKSTWTLGVTIGRKEHLDDCPELSKLVRQALFVGGVVKVAHVELDILSTAAVSRWRRSVCVWGAVAVVSRRAVVVIVVGWPPAVWGSGTGA